MGEKQAEGKPVDGKKADAKHYRKTELGEFVQYEPYSAYEAVPDPDLPWTGAVTFSAYDAERAAEDAIEGIRETVELFSRMIDNIMWSPSVENKAQKLRALTEEMVERLSLDDLDNAMQEAEFSEAVQVQKPTDLEEGAVDGESGLYMTVQFISPGVGNARDKHYYSPQVLKEAANLFVGVKQYETDHVEEQRSTRTWVSTIKEVLGFSEEGAIIGRVWVHNPDFAKAMRNLDEAGLQEMMECSIKGEGMAHPGKVNGENVSIVERISSIKAVDWVTAAGRGGKVIGIAEASSTTGENEMTEVKKTTEVVEDEEGKTTDVTEKVAVTVALEETDAAPSMLSAADVMRKVFAAQLPSQTLALQLVSESYADEAALDAAIAEKQAIIAELTAHLQEQGAKEPDAEGGGQVFGMSETLPRTVGKAPVKSDGKAFAEDDAVVPGPGAPKTLAEAQLEILKQNQMVGGLR